MIHLLIGHRGAGKSTFLKTLPLATVDLDSAVEQAAGLTINELFARGEKLFREFESATLKQVIGAAQEDTVIAVGAGFEGPLPSGVCVTWLKRTTDANGRCFVDRPRLNKNLSPWEEYQERFAPRERRFADWAHEELLLPEGYAGGLESFFNSSSWRLPYELTLLSENFREWESFYKKRRHWNIRYWEIRDDLLSEEQIKIALETLPLNEILFAQRLSHTQVPASVAWDWALELGLPPAGVSSVSLHEREEDFASTLRKLDTYSAQAHLKLAVEVKDFSELKQGHEWWLRDPLRRAFLPRSTDGRWRWYRSLFGARMPFHFFREGAGSNLDQPPLWQLLLQPKFVQNFAAVLGSPIEHSRSPVEQQAFFKDIPFVAIDVPEEEFSFALQFLRELGLKYAAVTSPLKKLAWACAQEVTSEARVTQSANTLFFNGTAFIAHNTDMLALHALKDKLAPYKKVWLWGGGGVKASVKAAWPQAVEISAREGVVPEESPDLVIWATGRSRKFAWPSGQVKPQLILDLNYGEDSPGLEWAVRETLPYKSGLEMFKLQASFQREFWATCDKELT